jgi:hypothetical protein
MQESVTKEFGLAATLLAKGCKMTEYTVDDMGRLWFHFAADPQVEELIKGYYNNTVEIRIQDFLASQSALKSLVWETKRKHDENIIGRISKATSIPIRTGK